MSDNIFMSERLEDVAFEKISPILTLKKDLILTSVCAHFSHWQEQTQDLPRVS